MANQVIYVPGLGDRRPRGQTLILKLWRFFGLKPHYFRIGWADKEGLAPKLDRLLAKIDNLSANGPVFLLGVSAGASAVIHAYARRPAIAGVVLICGKVNNPHNVNPWYYRRNPAFEQSLHAAPASLEKLSVAQRAKIMSIHPLRDATVPPQDTRIPGAVERVFPSIGHITSIFLIISFGVPIIAKFLKNQPSGT